MLGRIHSFTMLRNSQHLSRMALHLKHRIRVLQQEESMLSPRTSHKGVAQVRRVRVLKILNPTSPSLVLLLLR